MGDLRLGPNPSGSNGNNGRKQDRDSQPSEPTDSYRMELRIQGDATMLADHRLDGVGLLPAVVGTNLMHQAAQHVAGANHRLMLDDVRFLKPLKIRPTDEAMVTVEAQRTEDGGIVSTLKTQVKQGPRKGQWVEHFHAFFRPNPKIVSVSTLELGNLDQTGPLRDDIYSVYFHGPSFQVLDGIRLVGEKGLVAQARVGEVPLELDVVQGGSVGQDFPMLAVEAMLQAAGFLGIVRNGSVGLPTGIGKLSFLAEPEHIRQAKEWICRVVPVQTEQAGTTARYQVELRDQTGMLLAFSPAVELTSLPRPADLSRIQLKAGMELAEISLDRLGNPDRLVVDLDDLMTPAELTAAMSLANPKKRLEWIAGRLAAKEAVRVHLRDRYGAILAPHEIEILTDPAGAPVPSVRRRPEWAALLPALSITHAGGRAIAAALPAGPKGTRVGVDLTPVEARHESFETQWFTESERSLMALSMEAGKSREELVSVLWALKEAVSKALGLGLKLAASELEIMSLGPQGQALVRLAGRASKTAYRLGANKVVCGWRRTNGSVLAWAILDSNPDAVPSRSEATLPPARPEVLALAD